VKPVARNARGLVIDDRSRKAAPLRVPSWTNKTAEASCLHEEAFDAGGGRPPTSPLSPSYPPLGGSGADPDKLTPIPFLVSWVPAFFSRQHGVLGLRGNPGTQEKAVSTIQ